MITSRKKRPLVRKTATRDARLIIIATEGSKTEQIYFDVFHDTRIQIKVISSVGGKSAPNHVLANMDAFISTYDLASDDELWLVIDKDQWTHKSLQQVARTCNQKGINLAISNPCFELWLAHHLDHPLPLSITSQSLSDHIRNHVGSYNKSNYDPCYFADKVGNAVANAEALDNKKGRWPEPIGTRVYNLIKSISRLS